MTGDEQTTSGFSHGEMKTVAAKLAQSGLDLFAMLDCQCIDDGALPPNVTALALIGSSGRRLWDCLPDINQQHPIDDFSRAEVERVLMANARAGGWTILYPDRSGRPVPALQNLGRAAGWHHDSPLGNGIHPQHGLWFAYRVVVAFDDGAFDDSAFDASTIDGSAVDSAAGDSDTVDVNAADASTGDFALHSSRGSTFSSSPCLSCVGQPCINACPASALGIDRAPNLKACASFRSGEQSPCAERCLARETCPVGSHSKYADDQIRYFYRQSLQSLQRWVAETGSDN